MSLSINTTKRRAEESNDEVQQVPRKKLRQPSIFDHFSSCRKKEVSETLACNFDDIVNSVDVSNKSEVNIVLMLLPTSPPTSQKVGRGSYKKIDLPQQLEVAQYMIENRCSAEKVVTLRQFQELELKITTVKRWKKKLENLRKHYINLG
ncbi:hypothetical protein RCL1_003094 [Eukaryota sp. TZLM3-RCL]